MPNTDLAAAMRPWLGSWISVAESEHSVQPGLYRVCFRHEVDLPDPPSSLPLRISADSRYVLWVNGKEIGRGPIRSQPSRWTFDEYDIAAALGPGTNVLAILVTFYGEDNAIWQHARVPDGLGSRACLIVDPPHDWAPFATDANWTAHRSTAWSGLPGRGELGSLPVEVFDQRHHDESWLQPGGGEGWPMAELAAARHPGSANRAIPPVFPYGALRPRRLASLDGPVVSPTSVTAQRTARPSPGDPVDRAHEALGMPAQLVPHPDLIQTVAARESLLWQFDFGRVVAGFLEFEFEAPEGTTFDLAYLERPLAADADRRYLPRAGARAIAAGGPGRFRALESNGCRIAAVLATPSGSGRVRISGLRVREHLYPVTGAASFTCSDAELQRLWRAGVRTVQLNSSDAFTDCPTREQRAWIGDGFVHLGVQLVSNEDWRLAERYLELSDSPRPDGLLPMSVAGDIESAGGFTIPDWSLHWLHALWLYARTAKRAEFVRDRLPTAQRILDWFADYRTPDGVLADVPEWTLVDWSSVFTSGRAAILTALWARGLREFAELSEWIGNRTNARRATSLHERARDGFEQFWDPVRGVYVDHVLDARRMPAVSQAANAAAIVAGLVPPQRLDDIILQITDETRLVSRGWNAASPSVPLAQKVSDRADGVQRVDWDVQRSIVRAEPFFSAIVHEAIAQAGRPDLLPELLRRWSRFLADGYDTFGECWDWGTPAHGWSSTPAWDLVVHVLGIAPLDLDSDAYRIAPTPTGIEWMRATVPTVAGPLHVSVSGSLLHVRGNVTVRILTWAGTELTCPSGDHRVDLATGTVPDPSAADN